ncbi:LysR family transcriptional regulator [Winslowiella iniecta]|uniref:HTH lysR-type domain-containing protein n=1 Tax=Winslowiella iniecta TaxID=1560201 RepID=A0A0L7THC0_9GAMM|nr:LysR family transcriptional regulator [Winslowiella iniecta]KOC90298.1 hypothetical protein NG42_09530 [Winslowiella iniecta]KOC94740.1 hypothetical protein NG43_02810 [Winslowiella iniecta]
MRLEQVETFLAVVEYQSISLAAQKLYLGQSTVSHRLQLLEQELENRLFLRQRGLRHISLTAYGQAFLPIAHRWLALWRDTQRLKEKADYHVLTVGSVDIINNSTFVPFYQQLLVNSPHLRLDIRTHHSGEIYSLLENRTIDIGFVFGIKRYPDISSTPVFSEEMYLLCHADSDFHDGMSPEQLSPAQEIFIRWGADFEIWHDRYWANQRPLMRVNTGSMLEHYLNVPGRWSIVPMSCIRLLRHKQNLAWYTLQSPPPPFVCYQVTHRYPKPNYAAMINAFSQEVTRFAQGLH